MGILLVASSSLWAAPSLINGAGATFPYPLYSKWFSDYQKIDPEIQINYQSIGSGGGIQQFLKKTVNFGATDAPMNEEQLKKAESPVLHIPTVLGAVVVTYNLPGVASGLKLDHETISEIFLGKIKKWSDAKILKLNPEAKLTGDILVVHRSDGSGTSGVFTDYLAKVSPEWKQKVGQGTSVNWPVGLGGKGNEGVAGLVKQTPGAIGYVELIYAENNGLPYGSLKNAAGSFVVPNLKSVTAAAEGVTIPDDYRVSVTNSPSKAAYPISAFTYILVYKKMPDAGIGKKLVKFLKWAVKDGQKYAEGLKYAPLPPALVKRVEVTLSLIQGPDGKVYPK
jgi:phosphate transport system substrate-binding protein